MKYLVTPNEMKQYDRNTIELIGIPAMVLMERAALSAKDYLISKNKIREGSRVLIVTGTGNNGADGLALARILSDLNCGVTILTTKNATGATDCYKKQQQILARYSINTIQLENLDEEVCYDVIVDALFGIGLNRPVSQSNLCLLQKCNSMKGFKLALDVPSGIDCLNGRILGEAFCADTTITFGFDKLGLHLYPACDYVGEIVVADIGITGKAFCDSIPGHMYMDEDISKLFPKRKNNGNKGTFGKVLLISGSKNMAGAALLCGKACYRAGAGMVKLVSHEDNRIIIQSALPEALYGSTSDDMEDSINWADVIAIGPGINKGLTATMLLETAIRNSLKPLVMDADALNLLSENKLLAECLSKQCSEGRIGILTPHIVELKRLLRLVGRDIAVSDIKENPEAYGMELAEYLHAVVVVKDARTYVFSENHPVLVNFRGNNGMAVAGSGDVLTGIIAGLLAQERDGFRAAANGVTIHGIAGEKAGIRRGLHGCMPSDIIDAMYTEDCDSETEVN